MDTSDKWINEIGVLFSELGTLESDIRLIERWIWDNVVASDVLPRKLPSDIDSVISRANMRVAKARSTANGCIERFCRRPLDRLLRGLELSMEEFYLLRATGLVTAIVSDIGISPVDEFEAFKLLHYEDGERTCFINPNLPTRKKDEVGLRFGVSPEELSRRALRPEQEEFFRRYLPGLYERFGE